MTAVPLPASAPTGVAAVQAILTQVARRVVGQEAMVERLMIGLLTGGHVLLEDYPGTGKTTLAKALARSIDARFKRVQFTPDLLPSDILGVSIFDQRQQIGRASCRERVYSSV